MTTYPILTRAWWHRMFAFNEHGSPYSVPTIGVRLRPLFVYLRIWHFRLSIGGSFPVVSWKYLWTRTP